MADPIIGIIMGSNSDWDTMRHAAETLDALAVAHEVRIVSAHRTPQRLYEYASGAKARRTSPWSCSTRCASSAVGHLRVTSLLR